VQFDVQKSQAFWIFVDFDVYQHSLKFARFATLCRGGKRVGDYTFDSESV